MLSAEYKFNVCKNDASPHCCYYNAILILVCVRFDPAIPYTYFYGFQFL